MARWSTAWTACLLLTLAGCDTEEADPGPAAEAPHPTAPGFRQLYEALFVPSCSAQACHGSARGVAGLSFAEPRAAWTALTTALPVNPVAAERGDRLVVAGDLDRSFLWQKVVVDNTTLTIEGLGARMPLGGAGAPGAGTLAALRAWIEAGAPYEGQPFEADFTQNEDTSHYVA
ncbi:MAG: hypothetical protein R3F43_33075, partial [bacterium]